MARRSPYGTKAYRISEVTKTAVETERKDELRRRLADAGCRVTPQRLTILDALLQPGRHPTAEEIYADVLWTNPTTSLATVYKTVEVLKSLGELRELDLGLGRAHYDAVDPSDHPHVICTRCGRVDDVEIGRFGALLSEARRATGFRLDSQRLEFFGTCPECVGRDDPR